MIITPKDLIDSNPERIETIDGWFDDDKILSGGLNNNYVIHDIVKPAKVNYETYLKTNIIESMLALIKTVDNNKIESSNNYVYLNSKFTKIPRIKIKESNIVVCKKLDKAKTILLSKNKIKTFINNTLQRHKICLGGNINLNLIDSGSKSFIKQIKNNKKYIIENDYSKDDEKFILKDSNDITYQYYVWNFSDTHDNEIPSILSLCELYNVLVTNKCVWDHTLIKNDIISTEKNNIVIDKAQYYNLEKMLSSDSKNDIKLALEIISNSYIRDSINYIAILFQQFKKHLAYPTPSVKSIVDYLKIEFYDDILRQGDENGDDKFITYTYFNRLLNDDEKEILNRFMVKTINEKFRFCKVDENTKIGLDLLKSKSNDDDEEVIVDCIIK